MYSMLAGFCLLSTALCCCCCCWSLDTLLLVTFSYFGCGYGNSNSKILLFGVENE